MDERVLDLKQWLNLLGGELDYDYGTTEQPMGTSSNAAIPSSLDQLFGINSLVLTLAPQEILTSDIPAPKSWAAAQATTP